MHEMPTSWNYSLVTLSVIIAIIGSYIALYFANGLRTRQGGQRLLWTLFGASSMGLAIWSMHFIGMLAMSMPMPMAYDPFLSLLSIVAAAVGAGLAFLLFQRTTIGRVQYVFGSIAMGLAIATMHYTGMASMKMPMQIVYTPLLFVTSIVIAIVASAGALWLAFLSAAKSTQSFLVQKIGSAMVMGIAISGMHYTGMAAAHYYHTGNETYDFASPPVVGGFPLSDLLILAAILFAVALIVLSTYAMAEHQRMVDALRKSEEQYQLAMTGSSDGLWDWDHQTGVLFWNKRCYEQLGLPENTVITTEFFHNLIHPDDVAKVREVMQNHLQWDTPYEIEFRMRQASGQYRYYLARGKTLRDTEGRPLRTTGVRTDITRLKETELALAASERRFLLTFELAPVGIGHIGPNEKFTRLNRKYCEILGYTQEELLQLTFQDITYPEDLAADLALYTQLKNKEIPSYTREKRSIRKDGMLVWVNRSVSIVWDEQGMFDYAIVVVEDITQKKQSEEALASYATKLEQSNRDLEQFATIASHDLQAPLRKVILFSESLKEKEGANLSETGNDYIERMQRATKRMQDLISDLLSLSRVSRKGNPFQPNQLTDIIHAAMDDLEVIIRETSATVELVGDFPRLEVDERQMQQVFMNLIGNALKFHKDGEAPRVTITSEVRANRCQILVQDQGIGFEPVYAQRIFRVFERLHGESQYPGTGIGLAIVQKIIERHNGTIIAQGQSGQGATFIITLPLQQKNTIDKPTTAVSSSISRIR
jgi:PAS domain S-box-containing protein